MVMKSVGTELENTYSVPAVTLTNEYSPVQVKGEMLSGAPEHVGLYAAPDGYCPFGASKHPVGSRSSPPTKFKQNENTLPPSPEPSSYTRIVQLPFTCSPANTVFKSTPGPAP